MKKLKFILTWIGIIAYMVLTIAFVGKKEQQLLCNDIDVDIIDSTRTGFVAEEDIINLIDKKGFDIRGMELKSINTNILEATINNLVEVKQAEVYKTVDGKLKIEIDQREPILRVIDQNKNNFYIDAQGYFLPVSAKHTSHVIVANGHIPVIGMKKNKSVVHAFANNPENQDVQLIFNMYELAHYIHSDGFWEAQFVQLYINKNQEVELIPRVGAHIIKLGNMDNYIYKLFKLKALYFKGFNALGWNNYEIINLKYSNQVVCTKR